MSADLTPANAALCSSGTLDAFRRAMGRDTTPSVAEIAHELPWLYIDVVMAEEYPHPNTPVDKAQAKLDLALRALKQATIYHVKQVRREWIATA